MLMVIVLTSIQSLDTTNTSDYSQEITILLPGAPIWALGALNSSTNATKAFSYPGARNWAKINLALDRFRDQDSIIFSHSIRFLCTWDVG